MKPEELERSISKGEFAPLYFICGEEEFLADRAVNRLVDKLVDPAFKDFNYTVLYGKECKAEQILDGAMTLPMFAERRVILVKRAEELSAETLDELIPYMKSPSPGTCLIFHASKIDKRRKFFLELKKTDYLVEYEQLKYEQLDKFIVRFVQQEAARLGKRLETDAVDMLIYFSGNNLRELVAQMEKLAAYSGKRDVITCDDVQCMTSDTKVDTVFEFSKALANRNLERSLRQMQILLRDPDSPYSLLGAVGALAKKFRELIVLRELLDKRVAEHEIGKRSKLPPFILKEALPQARKFTMAELKKLFMLLHEFDLGLKSGARYETVLQMFVFEACSKKQG